MSKFQRIEDNCSQYMPLFDSLPPAQKLVPVDAMAKAFASFNQQWMQNTQSLKGIVVGKTNKRVYFHL